MYLCEVPILNLVPLTDALCDLIYCTVQAIAAQYRGENRFFVDHRTPTLDHILALLIERVYERSGQISTVEIDMYQRNFNEHGDLPTGCMHFRLIEGSY